MYMRVILGEYLLWGPCFVVVGGSGMGLWGSDARSKYPTCNRFLFHDRVMLILSLLVQTKTYYAVYAYHMNPGKPGVSEFCTFLPLGMVMYGSHVLATGVCKYVIAVLVWTGPFIRGFQHGVDSVCDCISEQPFSPKGPCRHIVYT